ncbi:MAG: hypothetical protein LAN63_10280 [Acidobacteriia bacterium]|nr:hypothetical protein [Terriglobia bacterium]
MGSRFSHLGTGKPAMCHPTLILSSSSANAEGMRHPKPLFPLVLLLAGVALGAPKPHVISFGKPTTVKWFVSPDESKALDLKIRPLYVDGRLKESTLGAAHDVTDRLFVVRRAFRVNDLLPEETASSPRWRWQRGGWLLVDRVTGRVSQIALPEFDPYYSVASWYRDYIAYCGVSEGGKTVYAVVTQLGRRKPVLKKALGEASAHDLPDSECPAPAWQRQPARVTFEPAPGQKLTYSLRGHVVDVVNDEDAEQEAAE